MMYSKIMCPKAGSLYLAREQNWHGDAILEANLPDANNPDRAERWMVAR